MKRIAIYLILAIAFAGCRSLRPLEQSAREDYHHTSETDIRTRIDSIYIHLRDSIYIREKADTVLVERWHTRLVYRDRLRTDTLRLIDTLRLTERQTVTVEVSQITGIQWFQLWCGRIFIGALVLLIIYMIVKWKLKR
jgi:hypothetical protein